MYPSCRYKCLSVNARTLHKSLILRQINSGDYNDGKNSGSFIAAAFKRLSAVFIFQQGSADPAEQKMIIISRNISFLFVTQ